MCDILIIWFIGLFIKTTVFFLHSVFPSFWFEVEYIHATKKINKQKLSVTHNLPKGILYPVLL